MEHRRKVSHHINGQAQKPLNLGDRTSLIGSVHKLNCGAWVAGAVKSLFWVEATNIIASGDIEGFNLRYARPSHSIDRGFLIIYMAIILQLQIKVTISLIQSRVPR